MDMKKVLWIILISFVIVAGSLEAGKGVAFSNTFPLNVSLTMDKAVYLKSPVPEPVSVKLYLGNPGGDVISYAGFSKEDFHLMLVFTDPNGGGIIADKFNNVAPEAGPPPIVWEGDVPVQAEAVEVLPGEPNNWSLTITVPDATAFYPLVTAGKYSVKAVVNVRTYDAVDFQVNGQDYSRIEGAGWAGAIESNTVEFSMVSDSDGDGYSYPVAVSPQYASAPDCDDNNPLVNPGATEILGNGLDDDCNPATPDVAAVAPGIVLVKAEKHTVGTGSHPSSTKSPVAGLPVRLFDASAGSCVSQLGVSWKYYKSVWLSCRPQAMGQTDSMGTATFTVAPGNYMLIGAYDPDSAKAADEIYVGKGPEYISSGETEKERLKIIEKADGKKVPAKYTVKTGSELLIIEPEYTEWDATQELYPFIFESVGDWAVSTSVNPPEGFVSDYKSLDATVNNSLESVQFTITDIGSRWISTGVTHKIKHKGKSEVVKSKIGIKLSERLSKAKGLHRLGEEIK